MGSPLTTRTSASGCRRGPLAESRRRRAAAGPAAAAAAPERARRALGPCRVSRRTGLADDAIESGEELCFLREGVSRQVLRKLRRATGWSKTA